MQSELPILSPFPEKKHLAKLAWVTVVESDGRFSIKGQTSGENTSATEIKDKGVIQS